MYRENCHDLFPRFSARPQFGLDTNVISIEMKIEEIVAFTVTEFQEEFL